MLIRWTMGEVIMDTQGEDNNLTAVFKAEKRIAFSFGKFL